MANLTSILPTSALPTDAAPTTLPSGYETAAPPSPSDTASSPSEGTGEIPSGGMTLQQLLDWLAYLLKKGFQGHTEADGEGSVKRNHARALKLN
jgi:hypothetical protein